MCPTPGEWRCRSPSRTQTCPWTRGYCGHLSFLFPKKKQRLMNRFKLNSFTFAKNHARLFEVVVNVLLREDWLIRLRTDFISNLLSGRKQFITIEVLAWRWQHTSKILTSTFLKLTSFLIITRPGSIRSSPRYGLSTPYRLTIRNSSRLFHIVL